MFTNQSLNLVFVSLCLPILFGLSSFSRFQTDPATPPVPVTVSATPLASPAACADPAAPQPFIAHDLDHTTTTADGVVRMFQANGAGLAVGDLDNDGDLDLVLGGQAGANSLFWNRGWLRFDRQPFGAGNARDVSILDVDGDGWRDIVLTLNTGALRYWRNLGDGDFTRVTLPGVARPAYVLDWADMDADGDLDLVAAAYDAGFLTDRGNDYLTDGGGVFYYENSEPPGGSRHEPIGAEGTSRRVDFKPHWLAAEAQALALALFDMDQDGRLDILVGNDFGVPDYAFVQTDDGWASAEPFAATTHSTMSFALGNIDNRGREELFATDMLPYSLAGDLGDAYAPLMAAMGDDPPMADDPQIMENVLQMGVDGGRFVNRAADWGVNGTGWSWSSQFGDLDNDGLLDLYVVNGMIEERVFAHMPDHELVEENQAFRNTGSSFEPAPEWNLNSTRSGRGMVMADLDMDGDLDIVVNNLRAPAQLFENRRCTGASLEVELVQPGVQNRDAIGAQIILHTTDGPQQRTVRAKGGYLSGQPARVHFGFGDATQLLQLKIRWPDGEVSLIDSPPPDQLLRVERVGSR